MGFSEIFFPKQKQVQQIEERNLSSNIANYSTDGSGGQSDPTVDLSQVKRIPTVSSCLDIITGSIAQLPIFLYKENEDGSIEKITNDPRTVLLNGEVNQYLTSYDYKKSLVEQYLMQGNTFTYIERVGNDVEALHLLEPDNVEIEKKINKNGYEFDLEFTYESSKFKPYELITIFRNTTDGSEGFGLLEQGKEVFNLSLKQNEYSKNILSNGALPIGMLKTSTRLSRDAITRLRNSFESLYNGSKNAGKTIILEEGLDYTALSLKPDELNLNESKKISNEDICTLFNIPKSLVLNGGTFSDEDNLHFMKYCISPIINAIENAFDKSLLLEKEKQSGYYFRFDISELERSTLKERYAYIEKGMKAGVTSINEARAMLDLPKTKKDYLLLSLGNIFYDTSTGQIEIPNTGKNIDDKNIGESKNGDKDTYDDE